MFDGRDEIDHPEKEFHGDSRSSKAPKRDWTWGGVGKVTATVVGAAAAVFGIFFGGLSIYRADGLQEEHNRLQRAQLDSHLEEVMMGLDEHFASMPQLRPFFFKTGKDERFPPPGPIRAQAMGTAELIIDFADDVGAYVQMRKMPTEDSARWAKIVGSYFKESPITRFVWSKFHKAYNSATACILGSPFGRDLVGWKWRTNSPPAPVRSCS